MVACTCDPITREVEEGEAEIQGHLQLFREFAVNPASGYARLFQKQTKAN